MMIKFGKHRYSRRVLYIQKPENVLIHDDFKFPPLEIDDDVVQKMKRGYRIGTELKEKSVPDLTEKYDIYLSPKNIRQVFQTLTCKKKRGSIVVCV